MAVFQFDYGTTGLNLYAFLRTWGTATVWNGSAFVAYSESNWTDYDLPMTEDTGSGTYFGTLPAVAAGNYSLTVYLRYGGAAAATDAPPVGSSVPDGPYAIGGTSPPPTPGTLATPAMEFDPPAPFASNLTSQPGYMNVGEVRFFTMDFDTQNELLSNGDAAISTGTVVSSDQAGLSAGTASWSRTELGTYLTAVSAGTYTVTYTASLNDTGTVIEREVTVTVY